MRRSAILVGLIAASLCSLPALAFQEMPEPPPADNPTAPPQSSALQLGTPEAAAGPLTEQTQEGGLNIFGYTVLPKLNLGLDILYGQDQQQQQLELQSPSTLDDKNDVTVLGRINRRF